MNISAAADTPFDDKHGFMDFLCQNEIAHIAYATALANSGHPVSTPLPAGDPLESPSWMTDHWQRHMDECSSLGIPVPDLAAADLKDEQQYLDWMQLHGQLHTAQNLKLGITT